MANSVATCNLSLQLASITTLPRNSFSITNKVKKWTYPSLLKNFYFFMFMYFFQTRKKRHFWGFQKAIITVDNALFSAQKHTRLHRGNWSKNTARVVLEYKGENRWSMQTVQQQEWPPKNVNQRKKEDFRNHQALFTGRLIPLTRPT